MFSISRAWWASQPPPPPPQTHTHTYTHTHNPSINFTPRATTAQMYDIEGYTPASARSLLLRKYFRKHAGVTDPRIKDVLLAKGEMELKETLEQWKQKVHLLDLLQEEEAEAEPWTCEEIVRRCVLFEAPVIPCTTPPHTHTLLFLPNLRLPLTSTFPPPSPPPPLVSPTPLQVRKQNLRRRNGVGGARPACFGRARGEATGAHKKQPAHAGGVCADRKGGAPDSKVGGAAAGGGRGKPPAPARRGGPLELRARAAVRGRGDGAFLIFHSR